VCSSPYNTGNFISIEISWEKNLQRAKSLGVFRFWRDLRYLIGALLTGVFTDFFSIEFSIAVIGILTILSSLVIIYRMYCKPAAKKVFIT
jgi:hypothetical protein